MRIWNDGVAVGWKQRNSITLTILAQHVNNTNVTCVAEATNTVYTTNCPSVSVTKNIKRTSRLNFSTRPDNDCLSELEIKVTQ